MNKAKHLILILIIILILITICLSIILINNNSESKKKEMFEENYNKGIEQMNKIEDEEDDILVSLTSKSDYFIIKKNIDEYINCINFIKTNPTEENKTRVFDKLDKEYTNFHSLTKNDIQDFYNDYTENNEFYIDEVYVKDINQTVTTYIIYGRLIDKTNYTSQEYGFIMQRDNANRTFSLIPYDYMKIKGLTNLKEGDLPDLQKKDKIDINEYNKFEIRLYSDEELVNEYFKRFVNDVKYDTNHLYKILYSEYKQKKFNSEDEFNRYISILKENEIELNKYSIDNKNGQYICIDTQGRYYIFKTNTVLDYAIILDTYTIDLPEFIERYNSTNEQGKVALNIQKFEQALNEKDYKYAYNCLSDGFKNNYFKTQEDFENYINQNWFNSNFNVGYVDFKEESGLYEYVITITNKENTQERFEKTIIMKLNEGTDFEMSFNV